MTILVMHEGKRFVARVFYNFKQAGNAILLSFTKPYDLDERTMILTFDSDQANWIELRGAHKRNPKLFEQILYKLKNVVNSRLVSKKNRVLL